MLTHLAKRGAYRLYTLQPTVTRSLAANFPVYRPISIGTPRYAMSTSAHPVHSSADPAPTNEARLPLPDVTAPHDTAAPGVVADAPVKGEKAEKGDKADKADKKGQQKEGKSKDKKDKKGGGSSGPLEISPPPAYFEERIKIFDEHMAKYKQFVAGELIYLVVGIETCVLAAGYGVASYTSHDVSNQKA